LDHERRYRGLLLQGWGMGMVVCNYGIINVPVRYSLVRIKGIIVV
jgi:hypothetical protein